jgi:hypothetical protein
VTSAEAQAEQQLAAGILTGWIHDAHAAARKRSAVAFREAMDMHELWRWLHAERWGTAA